MRIEWEVFGEKQVDRDFMRLIDNATDFTPAFRVTVKFIRSELRKNFRSGGRYASGGWKPLKDATIAAKRAAHQDRGILRATLALEKSLIQKSGDGFELIQPHQFAFGSTVEYGQYHQRGNANLPRRRPAELREAARVEIVKKLQRYVMTGKV